MKNTWKQADTTWDPACTIRIAVLPGDDIMQRQGKWRVISPDEVRDSFLLQMAERLGQDADEDEQAKWKKLCLTVPAIFELVASEEDLFLRSADLREKGSTVLAAIKRTPLGRIMEVLRFKQSMEKS